MYVRVTHEFSFFCNSMFADEFNWLTLFLCIMFTVNIVITALRKIFPLIHT